MTAEALQDALAGFTACIGEALPDICSYGLTIGSSYVPFNPDPDDPCEDGESMCSQAWVRMTDVQIVATDSWTGDCASVKRVGLEVGVIRCLDIPEEGEAPTAQEVLVAALQSVEDMNSVQCAAMSCEVWDSIEAGEWVPLGPSGGQYGGMWTFTVEV